MATLRDRVKTKIAFQDQGTPVPAAGNMRNFKASGGARWSSFKQLLEPARLLPHFRTTRALPLSRQTLGALAIIALATAAQLSVMTLQYPFLFFFASNAINGLLWKRRVALAGVVLTTFLAYYAIVDPRGVFLIDDVADVIAIVTFTAIGIGEVLVLSALLSLSSSLETALERTRHAEAESRMLFAESNHRIKNNLHIVAVFLRMEARVAKDRETATTLNAAVARLHAVSEIHDQLSRANGERVDLDALMSSLCQHLGDSIADSQRITLSCESNCSMVLPSRTATSICLLANELVTNAIKHAFPDQATGKVSVKLRRSKQHILLTVQDNGQGMDETMMNSGRRFIDTLTQDLNGKLSFTSRHGTRANVRIPLAAEMDERPQA